VTERDPDGKDRTPTETAGWERELLERFAFAALKEQRAARRWGIFFKLVFVGYLVAALVLVRVDMRGVGPGVDADEITAVVDLKGVIADETPAGADNIAKGLRKAFEHEKTRGVILRINSPGGSPVQSGYINDEMHRLREEYPEIPLYAVIQDIGASGGYYVAVAAEEIYADKASIIGSIGVRMDGFGFVEAIDKLGIERRLITAGENKAFLDPFSPVREDDVEHVTGVLAEVHQQFINTVRRGRGERLADDDALFTGYVWTGESGLALGLVDGLGSAGYVAREVIGAETIVDFTPRQNVFDRLSKSVSTSIAEFLVNVRLPSY